jgi:hypothetical protein
VARVRTERRWVRGRTLPALALGRDRARLDEYRAELVELYRAIAAVSDSPVVVDSSKSPTYAYILAGAPEIELCVVHLIRDPRATSYSWSVDPHFHRTRGPAFGARWTLWNLEIETALRRRAQTYLRVRFEDFVRNPVDVTRAILATVEHEASDLPFVGRDAVRLPSHHMVEGHASRFRTGIVPITPSTAWRERLTRRRDLTTSLFALPLQLAYGYSPRDRAARDARLDTAAPNVAAVPEARPAHGTGAGIMGSTPEPRTTIAVQIARAGRAGVADAGRVRRRRGPGGRRREEASGADAKPRSVVVDRDDPERLAVRDKRVAAPLTNREPLDRASFRYAPDEPARPLRASAFRARRST